MIRLASDFVLSPTAPDGTGDTITLDNPVIGYRNICTFGSVSADHEAAGFPVSNITNARTREIWKSTATSVQKIYINGDGGNNIDYVAIARHNFGSSGCAVSILKYNGSTETVLIGDTVPPDDSPLIFRWTPTPCNQVRIKLTPNGVIPQMACAYTGLLLTLVRRIYVPHIPINYGRDNDIYNGQSQSGEFTGRIILNEFLSSKVTLKNLPPVWARTSLDPFLKASRSIPWFFAWRPNSYPNEVGFCTMQNKPQIQNQLVNGMMQVDFAFTGLGENLSQVTADP